MKNRARDVISSLVILGFGVLAFWLWYQVLKFGANRGGPWNWTSARLAAHPWPIAGLSVSSVMLWLLLRSIDKWEDRPNLFLLLVFALFFLGLFSLEKLGEPWGEGDELDSYLSGRVKHTMVLLLPEGRVYSLANAFTARRLQVSHR
jgi:hypothetical protein